MAAIKLKEQYASETECQQDLAIFNEGKEKTERMYYCSYWNADKRQRFYVPCTLEFYSKWRRMLSEEHRKRDEETRCIIASERYKNTYVICRADCKNCPFGKEHRDSRYLSLDEAMESECLLRSFRDGLLEDGIESFAMEEAKAWLRQEVAKLTKRDKRILILFGLGYNDSQIARIMEIAQTSVRYIRLNLLQTLRENYKNF